jgi:hypothetical protein
MAPPRLSIGQETFWTRIKHFGRKKNILGEDFSDVVGTNEWAKENVGSML